MHRWKVASRFPLIYEELVNGSGNVTIFMLQFLLVNNIKSSALPEMFDAEIAGSQQSWVYPLFLGMIILFQSLNLVNFLLMLKKVIS